MSKTVLSQPTQFSSIRSIDRTLSGATTPGLSGPESDGNEGVLRIPQSSSITGTSALDYLVSYQDTRCWGLTRLQRCSRCIIQLRPTEHRNRSKRVRILVALLRSHLG